MKQVSFTFVAAIKDKYLYKILGEEDITGKAAWWILRVTPEKLAVFSHIVKNDNIKLGEFGTILDSGYGAEIPDFLLRKFGFAA